MITSVTRLPPPGLREAQPSLLGQREQSHGMSHARRRTGFANVSAMTERPRLRRLASSAAATTALTSQPGMDSGGCGGTPLKQAAKPRRYGRILPR